MIRNNSSILAPEKKFFDGFVVESGNEMAYTAARLFCEDPDGCLMNPIFIYGLKGSGKTHLLSTIYWELKKKFPEKIMLFNNSEQFSLELVQAIKNKTIASFNEKYREKIDFLFLDDFHIIECKKHTINEFMQIYDELIHSGKKIVLTSEKKPIDFSLKNKKLSSRLSGGLVIDIQEGERVTKKKIITSKILMNFKNIPVDSESIELILEKGLDRYCDIDELLVFLSAKLSISGKRAVQQDIERVITEFFQVKGKVLSIAKIIEFVAHKENVTIDKLLSKKKSVNTTLARQLVIYLSKELLENQTYSQIGKELNRHYTGIIHSLNDFKDRLENDADLKEYVERMKEELLSIS